jgi:prepilin-type N-terminal cleavage/methylation domain-containing protein
MATEKPPRPAARGGRLADQRGFMLIELLIAVMVLAVAMVALLTTFDSSRKLATAAEMHDTAAGIAEGEVARIEAFPWAEVALAVNPTQNPSPGTNDPTYYYSSSGSCAGSSNPPQTTPCYEWDWSSSTEPLVVCPAKSGKVWCDETGGDSTANPQSWSHTVSTANGAVRLSGKIYRFITWASDPKSTAAACGGTNDYKRITVAVTVEQKAFSATIAPVVLSTLYTNPVGAKVNPLTQAGVECLDHGVLQKCDY